MCNIVIEKGRLRKHRIGGKIDDLAYSEYQHWYYYSQHTIENNNNNRQGILTFKEAHAFKR